MNTFLTKISRLDSIHDVILLSRHGELLFSIPHAVPLRDEKDLKSWSSIIAGLGSPTSAELLFDRGLYYLRSIAIGYVIVGMRDDVSLEKVRTACVSVQAKLTDTHVRRRTLLKMLGEAEDRLKPQIIKELVAVADGEVAEILIALLQSARQMDPEVKKRLLLFTCQVLGHCSSDTAIAPLQQFLQEAGQTGIGSDVEQAALISLRQLQLNISPGKMPQPPAGKPVIAGVNTGGDGVPLSESREKKINGISFEEGQIQACLDQGKKKEAVTLIMQLIESTAHRKMFAKAEQLRDLLIRTDPMSLMDIIHAAEIIEQEKTASISREYLATWKELAEILAPDEFASLYHTMTLKKYSNGKMVVQQGEFRPILFFVNSGRVQLFAMSEGREVSVKIIGPGEIMGARTFFDPSVWTINAKSLGAELFLFPREKLPILKENYPAIESKLIDFHSRFQSPNALFTKTKRNRRRFERKDISGRVAVSILDKNGKDTGVGSKGDLFDISKGGTSFCLRISQKKNAILLFGKHIKITISSGSKGTIFTRCGVIVAVRGHHIVGNEYSIHVQFDVPLDGMEMQQVYNGVQVVV